MPWLTVTLLPTWQRMLQALGCIQALADQQHLGSNLGQFAYRLAEYPYRGCRTPPAAWREKNPKPSAWLGQESPITLPPPPTPPAVLSAVIFLSLEQ